MKDQKDSEILIKKVADGVQMEQAHSEMDGPSNERHWYLARDGKRYGPVGEDDLRRLHAVGKIKPTDHLWRQGFVEWRAASDMSDFFASGLAGDVEAGPRLVRRAQMEQAAAHGDSSAPTLRAEPLVDRPELESGRMRSGAPFSDFPAGLVTGDVGDPHFQTIERYRPRRSLLKMFAYVAAAVLVLAIGGLVTLPIFLPADLARDQIIAFVKAETGRDLIVRGKTKISTVPNFGLELRDVTLANPSGVAGDPLMRAAVLNVHLKILPLFVGRIEFAQFILKDPIVALRIDREGRNNWSFTSAKTGAAGSGKAHKSAGLGRVPGGERVSPATMTTKRFSFAGPALAAGPGKVGSGSYFVPRDLRLGDVRVINGTLTYSDERNGAEQKFEDMNISLSLEELAEPMKAEGAFKWRSEEILVKAELESPQAVMEGRPSPVKLNVGARHGSADFAGDVSLADAFKFVGNGEANITSLRSMAEWFGSRMPPGSGFGPMSYRSALKMDDRSIAFDKVVLTLDGMNAEGNISADITKKRPHIQADLTFDRLDLNPYLGGTASIDINQNSLRKAERKSLTRLIEKINMTGSKEVAAGSDASKPAASIVADRLVTASLGGGDGDLFAAADADIILSVSRIFYGGIKVGKSRLVSKLRDGSLTADLTEAELYGGTATGQIVLGGGKAAQRFSGVLELKNFSALPFLKDAADFNWVSGRGEIIFDVVGVGATKKEILESLQGRGQFRFFDGALEGINIPQMVRAFKRGQLSNWSREEKLKTDFSVFSAKFKIDKGLAKTKDISFKGPLLRIGGKGTVNLAKEILDLRLRPKLVANLDGQAGQQNVSGLNFPLRITGPWHKPNISPDLKGIAEDPESISDAIAQARKALGGLKKGDFKGKRFEDLINNFLGNKGGEPGAEPPGAPDSGGFIPRVLPQ